MATPTAPTSYDSIEVMVADHIVELLTAYCQTTITDTDYQATLIRAGRLQASPVDPRIYILVYRNDPRDTQNEPTRSDTLTAKSMNEGIYVPTYELGGGEFRWIRYTIEVGVYLTRTKEDRDAAAAIAAWVQGRVRQAIRENKALNLTDSFGEQASLMVVQSANARELGGPPSSHIWKEYLYVSALVESNESLM